MPSKRISELNILDTAENSDLLPIVDESETNVLIKTKRITKQNLLKEVVETAETANQNASDALVLAESAQDTVNTHVTDLDNPHEVTKAQIELGNVTNDSQVKRSEMGANNGVATLDGSGKVPTSQLPALAITKTFVVLNQAEQLALSAEEGDVAIRVDLSKSFIKNSGTSGTMADWNELLTPTDTVLSVNGQTGNVTLTTSNISEGTNLYFTNARARSAISETITGIDYNSSTGVFSLTAGYGIPTTTKQTNWDTAYGWGNHASAGYLTSYTETDPVYVASSWYSTGNNAGNWDTAFAWGDHSLIGYLTSESDPVYTGSSWYSTTNNSSNWDTAYSWGDHAGYGYLTSISGLDHNSLTNLSTGDVHTQYALLAGRATPQQFAFGTLTGSSTGRLTSTAHATKGKYFLNSAGTITVDELNLRFGIGTASPRTHFEIYGDSLANVGSFLFDQPTAPDGSTNKGPHFFMKSAGIDRGWVGFFDSASHGSGTQLNIKSTVNIGFAGGSVGAGNQMTLIGSTGNFGIGTASISARLHVVSTTEQLRIGYDASNYFNATVGSTGITTFNAVGSGSAFVFSDPVTINGLLTLSAQNIATDTTTGMKIGTATGQKISLWNNTPIIQPTTAIASATFVTNTSLIANDTATFDGYTIGQVVKALRNFGVLA